MREILFLFTDVDCGVCSHEDFLNDSRLVIFHSPSGRADITSLSLFLARLPYSKDRLAWQSDTLRLCESPCQNPITENQIPSTHAESDFEYLQDWGKVTSHYRIGIPPELISHRPILGVRGY